LNWITCLEKLESFSKREDKLQLLKENKKTLVPVFKAALGDSRYHITSKQLSKRPVTYKRKSDKAERLPSFFKLLDILSSRQITGGNALNETCAFLENSSENEAKWFIRILDKKLRINVALKQLEMAWGEDTAQKIRFRPFEFMKAKDSGDIDSNKVYSIEPKFDGQRIGFIYDNTQGKEETMALSTAYSDYSDHFIPLLMAMKAFAKKSKLSHLLLDSEVIAKDFTWNTTRKLLSAGRSVTGRKVSKEELTKRLDSLYVIGFDVLVNKNYEAILRARKKWVNVTIPSLQLPFLKRCPSIIKKGNSKLIYRARDFCVSKWGLEGVITKDLESSYQQGKKSKDWIKFKREGDTLDVKIIDYVEGKGRNKGRLGAFVYEIPDTGKTARVGAFTDKARTLFWGYRKKMLGVTIEITSQNDSTAKVRFPEFVRLRLDKGI